MKNKGFTLLEVMLAITVLTVAVAGSFALIQQTLIAASLNKSKITAYYLAQEGIELARNIRDSNWLEQRDPFVEISWREDLDVGFWQADYTHTGLVSLYGDGQYLNIDDDGFYGYSGDTPTPFKRKITVANLGDDALEVSVDVEWSERGRDHKVTVVEHLYNWWYGY